MMYKTRCGQVFSFENSSLLLDEFRAINIPRVTRRGNIMPNIVVINESTAISNADLQKMLPAFEQQWNQDLQSAWRVEPASFNFLPQQKAPAAGSWWLVFLDNSDQASSLAYHDLSNDGSP